MTLLEIQVVVIQDDIAGIRDDVTELDEDLTGLDQDVNFLFDEQVIQDERIFTLEQTSIEIDEEVESEFSFYILLLNKITCLCYLFLLCLLCRFTSHNNKSGFASHNSGGKWRE